MLLSQYAYYGGLFREEDVLKKNGKALVFVCAHKARPPSNMKQIDSKYARSQRSSQVMIR
jgi:hypothetical protein